MITDLQIVNINSTVIRVTWVDDPLSSFTEIWRSVDGADFALLTTIKHGAQTYDDSDIDLGSTYIYQLRSVNVTASDSKMSQNVLSYFQDTLAGYSMNSSNNFPADYYNGKTYIVYQGYDDDPYITHYDHTAKIWAEPVRIGTNPLSNGDGHGVPCILVDNTGYIHCLWGAHGGTVNYSKSTNPEDITVWTSKSSPAYGTYPSLMQLSDNTIYLFYRAGGNGANWHYRSSANNGDTWSSATDLLDGDEASGDGFAVGVFRKGNSDIIHCVGNKGTSDANKQNIYYLYFNGTNWKNIAGDNLTIPILPGASILAYDTGDDWSVLPTYHFDSSNNVKIAFQLGHTEIPTTGGAGVFNYKFLYHNGSDWVLTDIGAQGNHHGDCVGGVISSDDGNTITVYLISGGTAGTMGGNIEEYKSTNGGTTWSNTKRVATGQFLEPNIVRNSNADSRLVFSEYNSSVVVWNFKGYLWNDNGVVRRFV